MNHRQGARTPVNIETLVDDTRPPLRITDVSLGGLFVRGTVHDLSIGSPLVLWFRLDRPNGAETYRWRGVVVRVATGGVGALFESADPLDQRGLLALMTAADEDRQRRASRR